MIKLSKEIDYTIQFLLKLAGQPESSPLSIRKFSKESSISFLFLQRIAGKLRESGIVNSIQGANGGYVLAIPAEKLTLKDVVVAIEGEPDVVQCIKYNKNCKLQAECGARTVFQKINNDLLNYFETLIIDKYVE